MFQCMYEMLLAPEMMGVSISYKLTDTCSFVWCMPFPCQMLAAVYTSLRVSYTGIVPVLGAGETAAGANPRFLHQPFAHRNGSKVRLRGILLRIIRGCKLHG
jgi:hypothetical protein